jgi:isopenicillin N synthase-like dioxygenase
LENYRDACDGLNKILHRATAEMLGLDDPTTFDKYFWGPGENDKQGFSSIRILHYTPLAEASEERIAQLARAEDGDKAPLSLGMHRDATAFFTILINDADGLEVLDHTGHWVQAPPKAGHAIANVGMPLMLLTGGYLLATMHR